jgi:hypothetical protein
MGLGILIGETTMLQTNPKQRAVTVDRRFTSKETSTSKKSPNHIRRDRRAASKTSIIRFIADGELLLAPNVRRPITLQAASFDGAIPAFVELTPDSDSSELAFRVGFSHSHLQLSVGGREFSARIARRLKNTPLLWLHASDVFAGLFPAETQS